MARVYVIAGFPGVGKSTVTANMQITSYDSDSSKFDKTHFPENYISHIREIKEKHESDGTNRDVVIFVSTHEIVRKALEAANIPFSLVYPMTDNKSEYLQRYRNRGSPDAFIKLLDENFATWIGQCESQKCQGKYVLLPRQYMADALPSILRKM